MNKKFIYLLLILIVGVAAVLRLWQLGLVPPSPDWDEVALGYDAYSLIKTGKDEFGKFLPVVLRSFDDYKPALYAYLSIPTVLVFGLDTFAVRLPSAIMGIISVVAVFFLVRELFEKYKYRDALALLSSFVFALSPWSIQFSRIGFEANVGVGLNILTALFFLKGLKRPWMLPLSAVFAALGPYVYQSERVFSPLLVVILAAVYSKELLKIPKKYLFTTLLVGLLMIFPMVHYIFTDKSALLRVRGTSFFSYQTELLSGNIENIERDRAAGNYIGEILDNRRIVYVKTAAAGFLSHFDPNWLFIRGDISRHHAPFMGLIYIFELPFILIGIYSLVFGNFKRSTKLLIFLWFLAAPIPASITTGVPHAVRTLNFLPTWQIFSALGLLTALIWALNFKNHFLKLRLGFLMIGAAGIFFAFNFLYYLNQYFVQQNYYYSQEWQYGYEQAVETVKKIGDDYDKIIVSDSQPMDKSYMFFLFYLKYPPNEYQRIGATSSGSFVSHHHFDKYEFRPIDWEKDSAMDKVLLIGPPFELPSTNGLIQVIKNLDGEEAIRIVGT